jgi:MoaA/NifB/PqqE/SkfB family radical SAM enzyme
MYSYDSIRAVHLEITDKCNAACPQCERNLQGGADNPLLPLVELSLADVQTIFPSDFLAQLTSLYANGNWGDAIVARDTLAIFDYFRRSNGTLRLGLHTNGGARPREWWSELARILQPAGHVVFGIDGLEDTNHLYRRNTRGDVIMRNAQAFIDAGGAADWAFIVFRHNEHQVEGARTLAQRMGFRSFHTKRTARFLDFRGLRVLDRTPVRNQAGAVEYHLERPTDPEWNNAELMKIAMLRDRYGDADEYLRTCTISCKAVAESKIYVSADGYVLPCCWLGLDLYREPKRRDETFARILDEADGLRRLDAKLRSIRTIVEGPLFQRHVPEGWLSDAPTHGRIKTCAQTCGREFDAFAAQMSGRP